MSERTRQSKALFDCFPWYNIWVSQVKSKNVASKNACRALAQYIDANPSTSLKEVRFVIHPEDNDTFKVKTGNDLVMRLQIKINGF